MTKYENIRYSSWELFKDIWQFIKKYKSKFFIGTFLRITSDLVWLFPPFALSEIITFAANYQLGSDTTYAWQLLVAILIIAIYHYIFHDVAKYFVYQVAENAGIDAQTSTIKHLHKLDMNWHEKESTGNKMQKIAKGGESLNRLIRVYIELTIESTINLVAILLILATINKYFSLILAFFFITYYFLSFNLTHKAVKQAHVTNLEWEKFNGIAYESINNISTIKSLGIGKGIYPFLIKISKKLKEKIKKRIQHFRVRGGILSLYQETFRFIIVGFTLWQIFLGNLEVGIIAMVILYFRKIEEASYEYASMYNEFVTAKIDLYRMKEVLRELPSIEDSGNKKFNTKWKQLDFKNIRFSYHKKNILQNFSLSIKRGEKIGIVGISGTGKSTLFKLILKLYNDYEGEIAFDTTQLKDIKRESYIKHIAVVPQETELFNLSLEENITLTQNRKNIQLLKKALKIAHVQDFIYKLPKGIKSLVGEKGIKLSGGEKQRVGIARAIYKKPDLLLLDEATSHLDIESEKKIQDSLHKFFKNVTAIVIAHRLSTIKEMDKIVVIDKGKVIEFGTFTKLMKQKGAFFRLWEKQKF